jgi:hypothetical protein
MGVLKMITVQQVRYRQPEILKIQRFGLPDETDYSQRDCCDFAIELVDK